ncbi:hypothetical protein [Micromonospora sp. B9E7]|uniref:hypothetical protein n=1 Tax=Micromonospora sp. B9E7 TaxID=3153574 RepID=UPI00325D5810
MGEAGIAAASAEGGLDQVDAQTPLETAAALTATTGRVVSFDLAAIRHYCRTLLRKLPTSFAS